MTIGLKFIEPSYISMTGLGGVPGVGPSFDVSDRVRSREVTRAGRRGSVPPFWTPRREIRLLWVTRRLGQGSRLARELAGIGGKVQDKRWDDSEQQGSQRGDPEGRADAER